jgi:hypothetical protein
MLENVLQNFELFKIGESFPQASSQEVADFCWAAKKPEFVSF